MICRNTRSCSRVEALSVTWIQLLQLPLLLHAVWELPVDPPVHVLNPPSWAYWHVLGGQNITPQITIAYFFCQYSTIFGLHKVAKAPRCNMLRETAANFKPMRLWVLIFFSNFAPKFTQNGFLAPKFAFLNENFPTRRQIFRHLPTSQNLGGGEFTLLSTPLMSLNTSTSDPLVHLD